MRRLHVPFTVAFRHASAERSETSSLWAQAVSRGGATGCGESCPRSYVTGETLETGYAFFSRHETALCDGIVDLVSLRSWMASNATELDANPAAWCAIELAILDMLAKDNGQTVEAFLSLPELQGRFFYTAVLGDASSQVFEATANQYRSLGFTDFKLKLSGDADRDLAKLAILRRWKAESIRVRVDANNLWGTAGQAISFLRALDYPFFAIEEPLGPNQYNELVKIADALDCKIILDESFLRIGQLAMLRNTPACWLINLRVSKMGGLLRSLAVVEAVRQLSVGLIVGAQVGETSLLTRAALTVARAAGNALIAQEGAFGTRLLAHDVCDPPLMFGDGGVLDAATIPSLRSPGLGVFRPISS